MVKWVVGEKFLLALHCVIIHYPARFMHDITLHDFLVDVSNFLAMYNRHKTLLNRYNVAVSIPCASGIFTLGRPSPPPTQQIGIAMGIANTPLLIGGWPMLCRSQSSQAFGDRADGLGINYCFGKG